VSQPWLAANVRARDRGDSVGVVCAGAGAGDAAVARSPSRYARARLRDARYSFVRRTRSSASGGLVNRGCAARPGDVDIRGCLGLVVAPRRVGGRSPLGPPVLRWVLIYSCDGTY